MKQKQRHQEDSSYASNQARPTREMFYSAWEIRRTAKRQKLKQTHNKKHVHKLKISTYPITTMSTISNIVFLTAFKASTWSSGLFISLDTMSIIMPPNLGCIGINVFHKISKDIWWYGGHSAAKISVFIAQLQSHCNYVQYSIFQNIGWENGTLHQKESPLPSAHKEERNLILSVNILLKFKNLLP